MARPIPQPQVTRALLAACALLVVAGCGPAPVRNPAAVFAGFTDPHPSLLVTNPRTVATLEADRFSFGDVLGVRDPRLPRREDFSEESAATLLKSPVYADLVHALSAELTDYRRKTSSTGVGPAFEHRLFDISWLSSPRVHFELVGVVNRLDFRMLTPPGCGQTRLVYRLALQPATVYPGLHRTPRPQTRLPMTVNVIYENRQASCTDVAKDWLSVEGGGDVVQRLERGPLSMLDPTKVDRVEVNLQSMRQNSSGPTMDDHAEYLLLGFNVVDGHLVPDHLRDTPKTDLPPDRRAALRQWIVNNLQGIDTGAAEIPTEFLAQRAVSVAPRGLSRLGNRPFAQLFPEAETTFADLSFRGMQIATSPAMLVRRLDEMSCAGCHQSRTIAGFQLLGEDRTDGTFNTLTLGISEHLREILDWRFRFLTAAAAGQPWTEPRPIPERADGRGGEGAHCTITPALSSSPTEWPCDPGLRCVGNLVDGDPIGRCTVPGLPEAGDPCQTVTLTAKPGLDGDRVAADGATPCGSPSTSSRKYNPRAALTVASADGLTPATKGRAPLPARGARCEVNRNGFPGGMCSSLCNDNGKLGETGLCTAIPRMGFERACLEPGAIIEECLSDPPNHAVQLLQPCSRAEACRDDFACARFPSMPLDQGGCVPPYFIFQARVDGPPVDR